MKHLRHRAEPGTERRQQPRGSGRRGFLRQAGLAAIVVGGLERWELPRQRPGPPESQGLGPPESVPSSPRAKTSGLSTHAWKPGPDTKGIVVKPDCSCDITWYCFPGNCGSGCPNPEWCYFWYDSCNGQYGGPTCAWSNCATHVQCI